MKAGLEREKAAILVVMAALSDGSKVVVSAVPGYRESTRSWSEVLRDLRDRGLNCPRLVAGDGHLGIWGALRNVWPQAGEQRCWNHKIINVLDKLPKRQYEQGRLLRNIPYAETRAEAHRWCGDNSYGGKGGESTGLGRMVRLPQRAAPSYDQPGGVAVRGAAAQDRRRYQSAVIWKMLMVAEKRFRRLQAPELMADVYLGAIRGIAVEAQRRLITFTPLLSGPGQRGFCHRTSDTGH